MKLLQRKNNRHVQAANEAASTPIDLRGESNDRGDLERVLRWYPTHFVLAFGAPTRCPDCGCYGMVDHVDHRRGFTANSCLACTATWRISRSELQLAPVPSAQPHGGGILFREVGPGTLSPLAGELVSAN